MAFDLPFPRTRHVALAALEPALGADPATSAEGAARAEAAQACIVPLEALPPAAPPVLPSPGSGTAPEAPRPPVGNPPAAPPPASSAADAGKLARLIAVDLSRPRSGDEACLDEDGNRAGGAEPVRCPNSLEGHAHAAETAARAAREGDAVLLQGLARWYALGPQGAGYCASCEQALLESLRGTYGEHVLRFPVLAREGARDLPLAERRFSGLRDALRLQGPLEAAKRSILRARDEGRARGVPLLVFAETGPISALSLLLCRHLDGLVFALAGAEPLAALFPLAAARAALGERAAVAVAPAGVTAAQVAQLAALAAACDVDLMLPAGAGDEARAALARQRRYFALVRERHRASTPLADLEILYSPRADHVSHGGHLKESALLAAALAPSQLQLAVRLDQPSPGPQGRRVVALAGCTFLPEEQAAGIRRHVEAGGDLLLAGSCTLIDDEGRHGDPLFPDLKAGLDRRGEGRIWAVAPQGPLPEAALLQPLLLRAARELVGRGKQQITLAGRGQLLVRAFLDPERKLDVHLVNLEQQGGSLSPAQGLTLHIAGQAAGGGRTGYWFAPERASGGRDGERIVLNPSGFSVTTVLPAVGASALLAIPR